MSDPGDEMFDYADYPPNFGMDDAGTEEMSFSKRAITKLIREHEAYLLSWLHNHQSTIE